MSYQHRDIISIISMYKCSHCSQEISGAVKMCEGSRFAKMELQIKEFPPERERPDWLKCTVNSFTFKSNNV